MNKFNCGVKGRKSPSALQQEFARQRIKGTVPSSRYSVSKASLNKGLFISKSQRGLLCFEWFTFVPTSLSIGSRRHGAQRAYVSANSVLGGRGHRADKDVHRQVWEGFCLVKDWIGRTRDFCGLEGGQGLRHPINGVRARNPSSQSCDYPFLPGLASRWVLHSIWESETVAANGVAAINPPIDDTDPIWKFSIDPGSHTDLQKPVEFSPKEKPIRNFSVDTTSSIRTRLRTPFLRTPFLRLLQGALALSGNIKIERLHRQEQSSSTSETEIHQVELARATTSRILKCPFQLVEIFWCVRGSLVSCFSQLWERAGKTYQKS